MTKLGDERRTGVLRTAVHAASIEGLEGLTLGRLAVVSGVPKSALQALFGTKESLQLAIVAYAVDIFQHEVLTPSADVPDGLARLRVVMESWIDYLIIFDGGCLFVASASELDGRPGPTRDAITDAVVSGESLLVRQTDLAQRLGELPTEPDPEQVAFELHAVLLKANHDRQLLARDDALNRARTALDRILPPAP
ncbi:TetR/AcrR family transcriptional regulator [Solicola gregarius]|uniref:TetR/AcrR family transcriptional regulator n=1 Tax=Solicola gregarius TaxID=2908642 RepID=A0AA46YL91_9ACTN|nr:TetR/AcrR family transcriptional regulator [Solicola gregarius]UYM06342.1 TetR/AcrR family transcriptional regulator [Solicola gregarius]